MSYSLQVAVAGHTREHRISPAAASNASDFMTRYVNAYCPGKMVEFTSISVLKRNICTQQDLLQSGQASTQFIGLMQVDEPLFNQISRLRDRGSLPKSLRFMYDVSSEILIKLPTSFHELANRSILLQLNDLLVNAGINKTDYGWSGSTWFTGNLNTRRSKEHDESFIPLGRSVTNGAFPSFVIEVGVSESLSQLRLDAQFWLLNTNNQYNLVLIIFVNRNTR